MQWHRPRWHIVAGHSIISSYIIRTYIVSYIIIWMCKLIAYVLIISGMSAVYRFRDNMLGLALLGLALLGLTLSIRTVHDVIVPDVAQLGMASNRLCVFIL